MQPRRVNRLQIMTIIAYNLRFTYFLMQLWINLLILMSMLNQNRVLYYDTWLRSVQSKKFRSIHWLIWYFSRRFMILFLPFLILFQSLIYSFSRILCKKRFMKIQRKLTLIKFHIQWKYVDWDGTYWFYTRKHCDQYSCLFDTAYICYPESDIQKYRLC